MRSPQRSRFAQGTVRRGTIIACLLLAAGGAAAFLVLVGAGSSASASGLSTHQGRGDWAEVVISDFDITTVSDGVLEAKKQVEMRNALDVESALVEIVPEGTRAKKGDVLARLNTDQLAQQIDQQEIELERAKNEQASADSELEIQKTESSAETRKATVALQIAELEYEQWLRGEVETKRQELRVKLDEARSEAERLGVKVRQNVQLQGQGFISLDEMQKQELELRKQQAALQTAELNERVYESFQFPKEQKQKQEVIDAAKAELTKTQQRASSQLASKESRAANSRREVTLREQRLTKLREQLALATLTAPQDGLVVYGTTVENRWWNNEGPLQIGRKIYPNQLVIALPDTGAMNAKVKVHESIAGQIKAGQTATIRIDALGGKSVTGVVEKIGLLAEADNWRDPNLREYTVTINLGPEAAALDIRPSMRCSATILLEQVKTATTVPIQSVFAEGPVRYVLTQAQDGLARTPVTLGRVSDRFAQITAGLTPGQRVLVRAPKPAEIIPGDFTDEQLAAVGLRRAERGEVVPITPPAPQTASAAAAPSPAQPPAAPGVP